MQLSAKDRRILRRWADRIGADLDQQRQSRRSSGEFNWQPLLRDALRDYADHEPLRFLAAVIRAIPAGKAIDLGPLSSDLCDALLAFLRAMPAGDAQAAVTAAERLLQQGRNRGPDTGSGAL